MRIFFIVALVFTATSLTVPLLNDHPRCMMVFAYDAEETIKLDIKFPRVQDQQSQEHYQLSWRDTLTQEMSYDKIVSGEYKDEINVKENVVYELCFRFVTARHVGIIKVQYGAHTEFRVSQEAVKIPQSLLKTQDLEKTYLNTLDIKRVGDRFMQIQSKRAVEESSMFEKTRSLSGMLVGICRVQLIIMVAMAVYQVVSLRKYLINKCII